MSPAAAAAASASASSRWCPTPEQVMILEEMYKGGVRTPNAAQIQQITAHLSLYGKIEGKNVFYWFQNHKARDRQKLRKRLLAKHHQPPIHNNIIMFHPHPPTSLVDHIHPHHNHYYNHVHQPTTTHHFLRTHHHHHHQHHHPPAAAFHYLPPLTSPSAFPPPSQSQAEDAVPSITTPSNTWTTMKTRDGNYGKKNTRATPLSFPNDKDWTMLGEAPDDDHDHDHVDPVITRPLKTLELFPIKEKVFLKDN